MNTTELQVQRMHPFLSLVLLFLFFVSGLFLFSYLGIYIVTLLFGLDLSQTQELLDQGRFTEVDRNAILIFQAISTPIGGFILPVLVWNKWVEKRQSSTLFGVFPVNGIIVLILTFALVVVFMPVNSVFIDFNSSIILPDGLHALENWMKSTEQHLAKTTKFITDFNGIFELMVGVAVIGFLTAIGEELFFRGVFQTKLLEITKNPHWAIWITGFIFSFVHFQFYGFLPRMLLGVIFGYLYLWSGSLYVPIFAHFVNNTFTLVMIYLNNKHIINFDVESNNKMPWFIVLISTIFVVAILTHFYKNKTRREN